MTAGGAYAQNADSFYAEARKKAFDDKDYSTAIALSKRALAIAPSYTEITVFLGRLYAWDKKPDSARIYFEEALRKQPAPEDAYVAYADFEYWNDNNDASLAVSDKGLVHYPGSVPLLLTKAKVHFAKRDFPTAAVLADTVLSIDRNNAEARNLAAQMRDNVSKNRIGIKYDYVHFDKQFPDPWQLASIDYTRQTRAGSFTARVNYANRFNRTGLQYELESYPRFSRTFYGYLNVGYSEEVGVFPKWRAGASLFTNLPKAFESELGIRYLYFNSDVLVYTAYLGKYFRSFLFGARTFLTPHANNISQAYIVMMRYYYGSIDDYVGLNLGAGVSPDDRRVNVQLNSAYKLRSYNAELTFRHVIRRLNVITANVSVLNQEYLPNTIGNQLQLGLGYIRRF